jgi:threonyl-tRNA synthetase
VLRAFGFEEFTFNLSTKDPDKFVGTDEGWDEATAALRQALERHGLEYSVKDGDAAFYGPKIDIDVRDAIGRSWQLSTIQYDFNMNERFELEYVGADNNRHRPVMLHRALFGSIERFFGVLVEHYAGAFPPWLAPVQVVAIPIAERHNEYLDKVAARLRECGVRVEVDASDDRMQKKIRNAQVQKVPFMLIAGDRDVEDGAVSFRYRNGDQDNGVSVEDAIARVVDAVERRIQV